MSSKQHDPLLLPKKLQQQSTFIASIDKDGEYDMISHPSREYIRIYEVGNIITIIIMVVFFISKAVAAEESGYTSCKMYTQEQHITKHYTHSRGSFTRYL